jgi:cell division protein FtsN
MRLSHVVPLVLFLSAVLLAGCGTSQQTSTPAPQSAPPSAQQEPAVKQQPKPADKVDTLEVSTQNNRKPDYPPAPPAAITGGIAVQAGAYKLQESADRVAVLARERFSRPVSVQFDNTAGLYKVMIGSFTSKDEARRFRDQIVAQYPTDYKDAWVSETTPK